MTQKARDPFYGVKAIERRRQIERMEIQEALKRRPAPTPETVDQFDRICGEGEI